MIIIMYQTAEFAMKQIKINPNAGIIIEMFNKADNSGNVTYLDTVIYAKIK